MQCPKCKSDKPDDSKFCCFVSAKFGQLVIFPKLWFAYKNAEALDDRKKSLSLCKRMLTQG